MTGAGAAGAGGLGVAVPFEEGGKWVTVLFARFKFLTCALKEKDQSIIERIVRKT